MKQKSSDGSYKHVIGLSDNLCVEGVWIPQEDGVNLCISCQVGCPNKCRHCATGHVDFERDLTADEIYNQSRLLLDAHGANGKIKVLFMGMGEPLLNLEHVMSASEKMLNDNLVKSPKDIIVSTSGVSPFIKKFSKYNVRPQLAVTIGALPEEKRVKLIPTTKVFNLNSLIDSCVTFQEATNDKIIFEIPLIKDFNDSDDDAQNMTEIMKRFYCEIQVIPFNTFELSNMSKPSKKTTNKFVEILKANGLNVSVKNSFGTDLNAGCGQLSITNYAN